MVMVFIHPIERPSKKIRVYIQSNASDGPGFFSDTPQNPFPTQTRVAVTSAVISQLSEKEKSQIVLKKIPHNRGKNTNRYPNIWINSYYRKFIPDLGTVQKIEPLLIAKAYMNYKNWFRQYFSTRLKMEIPPNEGICHLIIAPEMLTWRQARVIYFLSEGLGAFPLLMPTIDSWPIINRITTAQISQRNSNPIKFLKGMTICSSEVIRHLPKPIQEIYKDPAAFIITVLYPSEGLFLGQTIHNDSTGRIKSEVLSRAIGYLWSSNDADLELGLIHLLSPRRKKMTNATIVTNPTQDLPSADIEGSEIFKILRSKIPSVHWFQRHHVKAEIIGKSIRGNGISHFAGHAKAYGDNVYLLCSDRPIKMTELNLKDHSIFFLNSCRTLTSRQLYTFFSKIPIRIPSTHLITTIWSVSDYTARCMSIEFYKHILFAPIGVALRRARYMAIQKSGSSDISALGYILFGLPIQIGDNLMYAVADHFAQRSEILWAEGNYLGAGILGKLNVHCLRQALKYINQNDNDKSSSIFIKGRILANIADYEWCFAEFFEKTNRLNEARAHFLRSSLFYYRTAKFYDTHGAWGYYESGYFTAWYNFAEARYLFIDSLHEIEKSSYVFASLEKAADTMPSKYKVEHRWIKRFGRTVAEKLGVIYGT
jgi:hypothetical protein